MIRLAFLAVASLLTAFVVGLICLLLILGIVAASFAAPAHATVPRCSIALTLALDYSSSVDATELKEQAKGHAAAILSEEFVHAFTGGEAWLQVVIVAGGVRDRPVPWTRVTSRADLEGISGAILTAPRPGSTFGTDLPKALGEIVETLPEVPCARHVVDLATDGDPDTGMSRAATLLALRETLDPGALQINVLFVGTDSRMEEFTRENLVFGFGAFFQRINDWHEIEGALRMKLLREVS